MQLSKNKTKRKKSATQANLFFQGALSQDEYYLKKKKASSSVYFHLTLVNNLTVLST